MAAKFKLKKSTGAQYFFNLIAGNGQVILTGEQYKKKASAEAGIASVNTNAKVDGRFERKESSSGKPYFVLKATNGQVVGQSQMYASTKAMEKGIESVRTNAPKAAVEDLTE